VVPMADRLTPERLADMRRIDAGIGQPERGTAASHRRELLAEVDGLTAERDGALWQRNRAVTVLADIADALGMTAEAVDDPALVGRAVRGALAERAAMRQRVLAECDRIEQPGLSGNTTIWQRAIAQQFRAAVDGESATEPPAAAIDAAHLARQREWSTRTFGPGPRTKGVIDHIRKELHEIEDDRSTSASGSTW